MVRLVVAAAIAGCAGVGGRTLPATLPAAPSEAPPSCPDGTVAAEGPAGPDAVQEEPSTSVSWCRRADGVPHGPHVERWPGEGGGGAVAVQGGWADGLRDGAWTRWDRGGTFAGEVVWRAGVQQGPRLEVGADGRVVHLEMVDGVAQDLRVRSLDEVSTRVKPDAAAAGAGSN